MNSKGNLRMSWWLLATALCWAAGLPAFAQQPPSGQSELQQLRTEVKQIEARIEALEASEKAKPTEGGAAGTASAAVSTPATPPATSEETQATAPPAGTAQPAASPAMDSMDSGMGGETIKIPFIPEIKIRGFGDMRAIVANQNLAVINSNNPGVTTLPTQGGNSTFARGIMDLFVTSRISETFSYLAEIGFEADPATNSIGVDLERAQISFTPNQRITVAAGRTHAMMGYYNTAFHHGTWFQTTVDRPHVYGFEDSGGPLPIHNVGISAMGEVPSGKLGLHWLAEVGNGKQSYSVEAAVTPANVLADHTGKSTNIGAYVRPPSIDGLQAGFNWYQASLVPIVAGLPGYETPQFAFPNAVNYYRQNIFVGHVIYIAHGLELMAEDAEIRDLPRGSARPLYTSGGYGEASRAFGSYRPYFRFQWLNPNFNDPNVAAVGRWVGPDMGVRWDVNPFVAMKLEYSHYDWRNFSADSAGNQILPVVHKTIDQLGMQIAYTF